MTAVRARLGQELQRLRDLAGLSGREMARRTGISQPTMTRIDRGTAVPSMLVVRRWLDECDAGEETRTRVVALAESALGETKRWSSLLARDRHLQGMVGDQDAVAARIRNFQPTVLPGLLQTAAYARAVLDLGRTDVAAALAGRLERQEVLHDPNRKFEFVITEQLLSWAPGAAALVGQADRLLSLATLDNIDLAVLPGSASPGVVLWHNFVMRDPAESGPTTVSTELQHGAQEIVDAESVRVYEQVWARVWAAAAHGDEAVALIRAAAGEVTR